MSDTESAKPKLLVVDDDPFYHVLLSSGMQDIYDVSCSFDTKIGTAIIEQLSYVVLDLKIPGSDAIVFMELLSPSAKNIDLVLISGASKKTMLNALKVAECYGFNSIKTLSKPFSFKQINKAIMAGHLYAETEKYLTESVYSPEAVSFSDFEFFEGLSCGQFTCVYQPQICLSTNKIVGVEALSRWQHPRLGVLCPVSFIDLANKPEYATDFFLITLDRALRDCSAVTEKSGCDFKVSVNLAPEVLKEHDLFDKIVELLQKHRFDSCNLVIEITEHGIDKFDVVALSTIARLRINEIEVSIDDFGTGNSGLSRIKNLGFDEIKIDKSFVDDIPHSENSKTILKNIMIMASELELRIVVEGIETDAQLHWFTEHIISPGISAQGYLLSRPIDKKNLLNLLQLNYGFLLNVA
tara:strand:+ start:2929 stop:4158 length:1230 start_codon:yes stop_codon:yes gene_type:complete